jgi:MSHA biogenesis protein MshP
MITAIVILVILAGLGAFVMSVTGMQGGSEALDVGGSRAFLAARAGIEWGIAQVTDPKNTNANLALPTPLPPACFASQSLTLPAAFDGMSVAVTCAVTATTEGNRQLSVYTIGATATGGGGSFPLSRQVRATVARCTDPAGAAPRFACN